MRGYGKERATFVVNVLKGRKGEVKKICYYKLKSLWWIREGIDIGRKLGGRESLLRGLLNS